MIKIPSVADTSWAYGLGSLVAFLLPWWLLPQGAFVWVLLAYTSLCLSALTLICLRMAGREVARAWRNRPRRPPSEANAPLQGPAAS